MTESVNDVRARWVDALRSGKYKQGIHYLRHQGHCCLGVLVEVLGGDWDGDCDPRASLPPKRILDAAGINNADACWLASMNDTDVPFDEIAEKIEMMEIQG